MNARIDHLIDEALALEPNERSAIAVTLLDSLDGEDSAAVARAWADEIRQRKQDLGSGAVQAVPSADPRATRIPVREHSTVIAPAAEGDIADAFVWYRERNALFADAFRAEVFATIDRIVAPPMAKAADEDGNRKRVLHRFPYTVFYDVADRSITILAVAHHRRSPRYWRSRRP